MYPKNKKRYWSFHLRTSKPIFWPIDWFLYEIIEFDKNRIHIQPVDYDLWDQYYTSSNIMLICMWFICFRRNVINILKPYFQRSNEGLFIHNARKGKLNLMLKMPYPVSIDFLRAVWFQKYMLAVLYGYSKLIPTLWIIVTLKKHANRANNNNLKF